MSVILFQNLTIFSDGSLLLNLNVNSKNVKLIKSLNKDLINFQKSFDKNSLNSLSYFNNTNIVTDTFRKKLFK